jgi:negative modulator of initiation of replication
MKSVDLDDDVYEFLRQHQTTFSESVSEVLRRLHNLNPPTSNGAHNAAPSTPAPAQASARDPREGALQDFLKSPPFLAERSVEGKFRAVLAHLFRENKAQFSIVEKFGGRTRKYFAQSNAELKQHGNSVNPKQIPGSPYWVVTNNSTHTRQELVLDVMKALGYAGGFAAFVAIKVD